MRYVVETDLRNFQAWSGAVDTLNTLIKYGDVDQVETYLDEVFCEGDPTDTEINDLLWFETDAIAEYLGFQNWEHYEDPFKYVCNELRDNISEDDLAFFAKVKGDLDDYIYNTYQDDDLKDISNIIYEVQELIDDLQDEDNEQENNED